MTGTSTKPRLYYKRVGSLSLMMTKCEACKEFHIFGFPQQIREEQKTVDRDKMVITVTDECKCGAQVSQNYALTEKMVHPEQC
jgi:hypothetical protein